MGEKLNDPDPLKINSAIYAFNSLVETVHKEKNSDSNSSRDSINDESIYEK